MAYENDEAAKITGISDIRDIRDWDSFSKEHTKEAIALFWDESRRPEKKASLNASYAQLKTRLEKTSSDVFFNIRD